MIVFISSIINGMVKQDLFFAKRAMGIQIGNVKGIVKLKIQTDNISTPLIKHTRICFKPTFPLEKKVFDPAVVLASVNTIIYYRTRL